MTHKPRGNYPVAFVYALIDPRTKRIRYVGQTVKVGRRLKQHLSEGRTSPYKARRRVAWVADLLAHDLEPELVILEQCSLEDAEEREMDWMTFLLDRGASLVNDNRALKRANSKLLKIGT